MWRSPFKIETHRYDLNRVPVNKRLCETCQVVEDESHVLLHCPLYADIRCNAIRGICQITAYCTT